MSSSITLASLGRHIAVVIVSLAIGLVASIVLIFSLGFVFAGPHGDKWVDWFAGHNGAPFFALTLALSAFAYPLLVRAKLKLFF